MLKVDAVDDDAVQIRALLELEYALYCVQETVPLQDGLPGGCVHGGGQHAEAPVLAVRDLNPARARAHGWLALRRLCGAQRRLT